MSTIKATGIDKLSALRVSYLEQCAALMARTSKSSLLDKRLTPTGSSQTDYYSRISSHMMGQLKEFGFVEQIKADREIKRSRCKICRLYMLPNETGSMPIKVTKRKKNIVRTCLNCNHETMYTHNPGYKSRNELKEMATDGE